MTAARVLMAIAAAGLALALLAAPASATIAGGPGDGVDITAFYVNPVKPPDTQSTIPTSHCWAPPAEGLLRRVPPACEDRPALTKAGSHPDLQIYIRYCDDWDPGSAPLYPRRGCTEQQTYDQLKDLVLRLPPGLIGNPQAAAPPCPTHLFLVFACPPNAQIGYAFTDPINNAGKVVTDAKLFNIQTLGLEPARFGTGAAVTADPPGPFPTIVKVRTAGPGIEGDFGIDAITPDIATRSGAAEAKVYEQRIILFGKLPNGNPFITLPTSCDAAPVIVRANSWQVPGTFAEKQDTITPTDCTGAEPVPFDPTVDIKPDVARGGTTQAAAPSAYTAEIGFPNSANDERVQSHVKSTDITLESDVALSPSAARGLKACQDAQFGLGNNDPVTCPSASIVGDVEVETPLLTTPLNGHAYFAQPSAPGRPTPANPWKLFFLIEGSGLRIKLAGDVTLSANPGQIRTTFEDLPQMSFTSFKLKLNGGDEAILANPPTCDTRTGAAVLTGWSSAIRNLAPSVTPTGCTVPQPFQPRVDEVSTNPTQAGALTRSRIVISRPDGHQLMSGLSLSLPAGAIGSLAVAPLCQRARALTGTCGVESKVGNIKTSAGSGRAPLQVPGSIFIAEPLQAGDAASIAIVIPGKVGPIDLGTVVVLNRVLLRQSDGGIDTVLDRVLVRRPDETMVPLPGGLPTILEGIPLPVQRIEINVNREGFFRNPTGCNPRPLKATFTSDQGQVATATALLRATGCEKLAFKPKLRLIAGGSKALTKKGEPPLRQVHPQLRAIVTQTSGEANIASTEVVLPWVLRPDLPRLQQPGALCQEAQVATRTCPPNSRVGTATAISPLLRAPLSGPVHVVQQFEPTNPLPRLAVYLDGEVSLRLRSQNRFFGGNDPRQRIRTVNTFISVPDVPVTSFELTIDGGPNGLFNNWRDLCKTPDTFDATFNSHSGRSFSFKRRLEVDGCKAKPTSVFKILTKRATMTRSGRLAVRVRCNSTKRCKGRLDIRTLSKVRVARESRRRKARRRRLTLGRRSFSIRAGKKRTVRVKLGRRARRAVLRAKRLRTRVTVVPRGKVIQAKRARKTITVKAPKRKRGKRRRR